MQLSTEKLILQITRSYLETPFHLQGRNKALGLDCGGLIINVAKELGVKLVLNFTSDYSTSSLYYQIEDILAMNFKPTTQPSLGSIALFKNFDATFHLGIIGDYPYQNKYSLIHACAKAEKVVEQRLTNKLLSKISKNYLFV